MRRLAAALLVAVAVLTVTAGCRSDGAEAMPADHGLVERVVDGDTVVVRFRGDDERVRLVGIDTPESVDPRRPVECLGKEAAAHLRQLLPEGTEVRLERDIEARDRYDRLLAYVHRVDDDLFVNLAMLEAGYAAPLTIPPNVAYTARFSAAARQAREAGRGLWSACQAR